MKKILILMSVAMLFACTQGDGKEFLEDEKPGNETENPADSLDDDMNGGINYGTSEGIFLVEDENGLNLLDPSNYTYSALAIKSIVKIYSQKEGLFYPYIDLHKQYSGMVYPQSGFDITTSYNKYATTIGVMHMYLEDYYSDQDIVSTIVDWGNGVKDTIDVSIQKKQGVEDGVKYYYLGYDKMWVNDKLIWDKTKADVLVDAISGGAARLVMSEGKTSSAAYSHLKALQ